LDPDAVLGELSRDDRQNYCQDLAAYAKKQAPSEILCRAQALEAASTAAEAGEDPVAACDVAFDACLQFVDAEYDRLCRTVGVYADCDSTVGDAASCSAQVVDGLADSLESFPTCEQLVEYSQDPWVTEEFVLPTLCSELGSGCYWSL
jgi:hypothetical protein